MCLKLWQIWIKIQTSLQYLGHVWWQLGTYEANVVVVDGIDAWYHHWSWRRLTRNAWIMAHVAVVPRFLHLTGPSDTKKIINRKHSKQPMSQVLVFTGALKHWNEAMNIFTQGLLTWCRKGRRPAGWEQTWCHWQTQRSRSSDTIAHYLPERHNKTVGRFDHICITESSSLPFLNVMFHKICYRKSCIKLLVVSCW